MKILLYGINFAPEITGVGKYTAEMASWLASQGHTVRVVTAQPYYPNWKVFDGYRSYIYSTERWQGADIFRCPLWVPKSPTGLTRLVHLLSFALSSMPAMVRQITWKPDVVWVVEPPFFCAPLALGIGAVCRAITVLHVQDFEVDAAFGLGLLKGERLRRVVTAAECFILQRFSIVSTISGKMMERLKKKRVQPKRTLLTGNWADIESVASGGSERRFRALLNIPADATVALYSGNMGRKQGLELLADVARSLAAEQDLYFVFCGNGVGKAELQASCEGLSNVRFLDLQPIELLPDLLGMADIHLLPQRADASDLVMPSKLCGMLASGKPVVATTMPGSELEAIVSRCGIVVPPENAQAAAEAVRELALDKPLARRLGLAGRKYAEANLDRNVILTNFVRAVQAAV